MRKYPINVYEVDVAPDQPRSDPKLIKLFSCSIQLSMKFQRLIKTDVEILGFSKFLI